MIIRGATYRLSPSLEQEEQLSQFVGVCRLVYNLCLEQRQVWRRQFKRVTGGNISFTTQGREITALRAEFDWVRATPCECLHQVARDLDAAFEAFFKKTAGYPSFRRKGENDSFRTKGRDLSIKPLNKKWSLVRLPKIGWMKFRSTKELRGTIKNATVCHKNGVWFISFVSEIEHQTPAPPVATVGIDRGVTTTLALSSGETMALPDSLKKLELRKRLSQRVAARRKRGSKRYRRIHARIARIQAKQARIRRSFHHNAALNISRRFGVAVLEDLKTRNMTASAKGTVTAPGRNVRQKSGLNRVILAAGWHQFQTILTYKMEERGGLVVTVQPEYTSQTCAACGVIDARSRKSQARFECVSCGHTAHADINAAINIERRWSTPLLGVEGLHKRPCEASTLKDLKSLDEPKLLSA
ncbi:transposase [Methylobacterium sp. SD21]|uniref:RNA-guided endonuclease InsQ/TnpB family protein n=1 Tax=Methylobacterium litchii TaxID=3138810 RepID=UPI00313D78CC